MLFVFIDINKQHVNEQSVNEYTFNVSYLNQIKTFQH